MTNAQSHESIVNDKTGEQSSEWCNFDSLLDEKGALVQYVGYCTRIHDNGDLMWSSFTGTTAEAPSPFTIIGGTGRFSGAAGSGITTTTSTRGDGLGTTFKNVGTLTVK
jgi:hypothetical protein